MHYCKFVAGCVGERVFFKSSTFDELRQKHTGLGLLWTALYVGKVVNKGRIFSTYFHKRFECNFRRRIRPISFNVKRSILDFVGRMSAVPHHLSVATGGFQRVTTDSSVVTTSHAGSVYWITRRVWSTVRRHRIADQSRNVRRLHSESTPGHWPSERLQQTLRRASL